MFTLAGCKVDGEEDIEIHSSGAVTIRVNYQVPEIGLSRVDGSEIVEFIQELSNRHESISLNELSCERAGNATVRLIVDIHFSDPIKIREMMAEELVILEKTGTTNLQLLAKIKAIIGEVSLRVDGINIKFNRSIKLHELLAYEAPNLSPDLLGKYQFRYSLTSPSPATQHNATITSNNGKTLVWVMPLKQHVITPFNMHATLPIPIPWWVWLMAVLVLLLLLWVLWKIFAYVRQRRRT